MNALKTKDYKVTHNPLTWLGIVLLMTGIVTVFIFIGLALYGGSIAYIAHDIISGFTSLKR